MLPFTAHHSLLKTAYNVDFSMTRNPTVFETSFRKSLFFNPQIVIYSKVTHSCMHLCVSLLTTEQKTYLFRHVVFHLHSTDFILKRK